MLWSTGPAATELETVMLDWLARLLGLPERFHSTGSGGGVIQDSASSATLVATLAALHRASGGRWRTGGVDRPYTVYTSTEGALVDREGGRGSPGSATTGSALVDVDDRLAMRPDALAAAIAADRAAGAVPALVVRHDRHHVTTAIDPLAAIGRDLPAAAGVAARRRRLRRGRRGLPRAAVDPRRRWSTPTRTASTRTSGCSPASTATPSGWPTGRR